MEFKRVKALFIDLDGTIRYSNDPKNEFVTLNNMAIFDEIPAILQKFQTEGWRIIVLTNQAGVAFGYKSRIDFESEVEELCKRLPTIDLMVYVAYGHPKATDAKYRINSMLRKPNTGMVCIAEIRCSKMGELIDYENSLFVGDRLEDKDCAANANIKFCDAALFRAMPLEEHCILENYR